MLPRAVPASSPGTRREALLIMVVSLLVAAARSPLLLLHGRVFAEEGTVYFQQAWDSGPLVALSSVHQGYYSLFMNGITLFAEKFIPLEQLAVALTLSSLLALMLTVYLV